MKEIISENSIQPHQQHFNNIFDSLTSGVSDMLSSTVNYASDIFSGINDSSFLLWSGTARDVVDSVIHMASANPEALVVMAATAISVGVIVHDLFSIDAIDENVYQQESNKMELIDAQLKSNPIL